MKYKVELQEIFSIEDCNNNPNKLYIFGDNLLSVGKGGQAIIRDCDNVFGIPTKRAPLRKDEALFHDNFDEYEAVKDSIQKLLIFISCNRQITLVFPENGLGTGLARMNQTSPKLFKYMNETLYKHFGVYYEYI